jgi:hypothetical protein
MVTLVMLAASLALASEVPESLARKLAEFKGAERGQLIAIADENFTRAFPGYMFYVLRFRQYPVAQAPPQPLKSNNLFVVKLDESVDYIGDDETLKAFFRASLAPVKTAAAARSAVKAWLRLSEEFYQDGFFQFSIPEDSLRAGSTGDGGIEASGKALVDKQGGNEGELDASFVFDRSGAVKKISESARIQQGVRPICQATKLLDPDPVVRRMAEQDILVMGRAAQEYLEEQRAKANPELQAAIDRIWQRIQDEKR